MESFMNFLKTKHGKWFVAVVAVVVIFIIFPQLLWTVLWLVAVAAPLVAVLIVYRIMRPRPQKAADDVVFNQYCGGLNANQMRNLIISGGNPNDRFAAIARILNEANRKKIPTIVLHSGFAPFMQFSQNAYYDPCVGKESDEIAEILTDAAANALNIDRVVHSSLKFIADLMQVIKGEDITLADIVKFPTDDVLSFLDDRRDDESITDNQYDKFKQRYNNPAVRDNIYKAAPLLAKLKPLAQKSGTTQAINFRQAVDDRQILFFDLLTDSNSVLKELVFADILKLTEICKFWVVTEGISFIGNPDSKVDVAFTRNRDNITLIYSGEDVPTLTLHTENIFNTLTGGSAQMLLFAHDSDVSAKKWADRFGEVNKTQTSHSTGRSTFQLGSNRNEQRTTVKEHKFPPQHFMKMGQVTDLNNRKVYWGLNDRECYFIQDSNAIIETQAKKRGFFVNMMGMAGHDIHDTYLPKIALPPAPLAIEDKAS